MTTRIPDEVAVTARWLGHRATRAVAEAIRSTVDLGPLDRALDDQAAVLGALWRLFDRAAVDPAGVEVPNPFAPAGMWPGRRERQAAIDAAIRLGLAVEYALHRLAAGGLPVDPGWSADAVVLAQVVLLDVDWSLPAHEIAAVVQPPVLYAVDRDARGVKFRRDPRTGTERAALAFRREVGARLRDAEQESLPGRGYAGGGTRAPGRQQVEAEQRRDVLHAVLVRFPDLEVADFLTGSGKRLGPHAEVFNRELAARGLPVWTRSDFRTRGWTLRNDLRLLRGDS